MVVIFHNPACSKSRETLRLIQEAGHTPEVIPYLEAGWTHALLRTLSAATGLRARDMLKRERSGADALGLLDDSLSDNTLFDAMVTHPGLVNRPFVVTAKGAALCRPPQEVLKLL